MISVKKMLLILSKQSFFFLLLFFTKRTTCFSPLEKQISFMGKTFEGPLSKWPYIILKVAFMDV
jgi:hypothetical protein